MRGSVASACGDQFFGISGSNMTFAEMIDYYSYKFGLVCLRETTTGEFCTEVEAG